MNVEGHPVEILALEVALLLDPGATNGNPLCLFSFRPQPDKCLHNWVLMLTREQCVRIRDTLNEFMNDKECWLFVSKVRQREMRSAWFRKIAIDACGPAFALLFHNHRPAPSFAGDSNRYVFHRFRSRIPHLVNLPGIDHHGIATTQCGGLRSGRDLCLPLHDNEDFLHVFMVVSGESLAYTETCPIDHLNTPRLEIGFLQ